VLDCYVHTRTYIKACPVLLAHSDWGYQFWGENRVMVCEDSSSQTAPSSELFKIASSSSSAESNFRELDDAFLQTQTRIWLGEVLQIRLDEELIISELLADGELLFQVSKVVWKLLLAKHMKLRHIKAYKIQPFASKKNIARYRPYSNVDSFLKICKILGLTGVDLFSPSDVVDRRNTRRVCMCIRSFSKKSRSMNINVPDFDIVTCMVAMPKDLVGCMRRNIELSHSILADSSGSYYLQKHARRKSRQGYSVKGTTSDYKTYSDQSEDTESKHLVLQFDDLHTDDLYDYTSDINYNIASPMVKRVYLPEDLDQLDVQNQQRNGIFNDDLELLCSMESLQYHCSEDVEHDCKLTWSSSLPSGDLHTNLIDMKSYSDTRMEQVRESSSIMDFDYFEHVSLSSNASVLVTPKNDKTPGKRDVSSLIKDREDPDLFHEENSTPNVYQSASSHGSNPTPQTAENGICFEIGDDKEVLQVACINCYSRQALNLGDQVDAENNFKNIVSFKVHKDKIDQWDKIKEEHESQGIVNCREMPYQIISKAGYSYFVKKFEETEPSLYSPDCYFCNTNSPDRVVPHSNDTSSSSLKKFLALEERESQVDLKCLDNASCFQSEESLSCQSYYLPESCKWDQKGKCAIKTYKDEKNSSCFLEDGSHEEITPCKQKASEVLSSVVKLDTDGKELNIDSLDLASNALAVDDGEKCSTLGDDPNDFYKGDTTQDFDEDTSLVESYTSSKLELNGGNQACQYEKDPVYRSEHTRVVHIKEEIKPEDESVHFLENLVGREEGGIEMPKAKPQKKLLLRSVLGGAAAVGLLFMILHLRRNGGEKSAQPSMASSHKGKEKIQKNYTRKVKSSTTKGVYPAERIKLK
ncbi:Protein OPAQUE10, partial [Mucuna pruriens]